MFRSNIGFAAGLTRRLDLSESEIKFLLGSSHEHLYKDILQWSENQVVAQQAIESEYSSEEKEIKSSDKVDVKQEIRQQRLF